MASKITYYCSLIALALSLSATAGTANPMLIGFTSGSPSLYPEFSNDGKYLAFVDRRLPDNGNYIGLYIIDLTQAYLRHEIDIVSRAGSIASPLFSLDSQYLTYRVTHPEDRILSVKMPSFQTAQLTMAGVRGFLAYPWFEQHLTYSGLVEGRRELFRVKMDGSGTISLTPGQHVYYYIAPPTWDKVWYSTLGRISTVSTNGGRSVQVFDSRERSNIFFSTSGDRQHLYFRYAGGVFIGPSRRYRTIYSMSVDGTGFQELIPRIDAHTFGWDRSQKATFFAVGDVPGPSFLDDHQAQFRIHNVHAGVHRVINMPQGYAARSYYGLRQIDGVEKPVISVGPSTEAHSYPEGTEAIWTVSNDDQFEELVPPNGDRGSFVFVGTNSNKVLRFVHEGESSNEDYVNLIDFPNGSERRVANGRFHYCEAEREGLVYLIRYESSGSGGRTLLVVNGNNGKQFETDLGPEADAQFLGDCHSPSNERLIVYYERFTFNDQLSGYKSYMMEVPLFSGSFEPD